MAEQARRGDQVFYFFSGREYPFARSPRLRRWDRGPVTMLEVLNSPLFDHGRQPRLELNEARMERIFSDVATSVRPDVIHVHELAGLPSSLLEIGAQHAPVVATLHDYFPLCSTFRLLDADSRPCLRRQVGQDCIASTAADDRRPGLMFEATLVHATLSLPFMRRLSSSRLERLVTRLARLAGRGAAAFAGRRLAGRPPSPADYQHRREVNLERLGRTGRLIAVSHRVAEIYALLGVESSRFVVLAPTLTHIERLQPRRARLDGQVTFATLGAGESTAKGAELLADAVDQLGTTAAAGRFRLIVLGFVEPEPRRRLGAIPGVELRGPYSPGQLDEILDEVDVGIIPSIWEEAYGLAGAEFLAKAIPVIGNAIGGIVDYTKENETGWLNRSCSARELATVMERLVEHPELIMDLNAKLRATRDSIITPMSRHAETLHELYEETCQDRSAGG